MSFAYPLLLGWPFAIRNMPHLFFLNCTRLEFFWTPLGYIWRIAQDTQKVKKKECQDRLLASFRNRWTRKLRCLIKTKITYLPYISLKITWAKFHFLLNHSLNLLLSWIFCWLPTLSWNWFWPDPITHCSESNLVNVIWSDIYKYLYFTYCPTELYKSSSLAKIMRLLFKNSVWFDFK